MSIPKTRLLPALVALVSVSIGLTACGLSNTFPTFFVMSVSFQKW